MVMFCPKCGGLMVPRKKNGKTILVCSKCGYIIDPSASKSSNRISGYKLTTKIEHSEKDKIIVIDEAKQPKVLPITHDVTCPKCGHHEAYYWLVQTRRADEPPTRFFKCTKCGYVWREYA